NEFGRGVARRVRHFGIQCPEVAGVVRSGDRTTSSDRRALVFARGRCFLRTGAAVQLQDHG
ncbi:MAG TPA: hypothetical protein VJ809_11575, partial [Pirellulales bacterium]|nr:hypothetical protein [Pirellulales bacterium]